MIADDRVFDGLVSIHRPRRRSLNGHETTYRYDEHIGKVWVVVIVIFSVVSLVSMDNNEYNYDLLSLDSNDGAIICRIVI